MKLHILSDLHREFGGNFQIPKTDANLIILAGDIDKGLAGVNWAFNESQRLGKQIIYVPGNHEYYGYTYKNPNIDLPNLSLDSSLNSNVWILNNQLVVTKGIRFLGTTLWSNFRGLGDNNYLQAKEDASTFISDYYQIRYNGINLTPNDTERFYNEALTWLHEELDKPFDGKTVLITHFGPSPQCHNWERHGKPEPVSAYFWSDIEDLIQPNKVDLVIYGHTHSNLRFEINGVPVICNQKGYKNENTISDTDFNPEYVIEI
jgi:predicted phosphodiesterase